jgi:FkbM family methyltransferase
MARRLVERFARGTVIRRSLPLDVGAARIYVSPDSQLKYLKRDLGTAEQSLLDQARALVRPGMRVWDIGANIGVFAFAAAGLAGVAGRVLAVEADPWLFSLLQRSRRAAAGQREAHAAVDLLCAAAAGAERVARFSIAARGRAANALEGMGGTQTGGSREAIMVGQVTLDDILAASFVPDLVKIDIEGAELLALSAAQHLLAARPLVLVEVGSANAKPLADLFRSAGYDLFDSARPLQSIRPIAECVWDTLAVPREMRADLNLHVVD